MIEPEAGLEPPNRSEPTPPAQPSGRAGSALVVTAGASLWVAVATVLQLVRSPGRPLWRSIWAEDGNVFLNDAIAHPVRSLAKSHAGYLQFMGRAVGSLAAVLPLEDAAATFAVTGCLVVSLVSVYVYFSSRSILGSRWARALLAASFVFAPVTAFEVAANGLDLHWYLLFACFLALWSTSEATAGIVADSVVVGLATLSGPLAVLYAPLALRRLRVGKTRRRWIVPGVYAAAVAAQTVTAVLFPAATQRYSDFRLINVPIAYGLRVAGSVLVGDHYLRSAWLNLGLLFAALSLLIVGATGLYAVIRARDQKLTLIVVASAYSVVMFTVSVYLRGTGEMRPPVGAFNLDGSRYTVVPVLLLITVLLVVADDPATFGPAWVVRSLAGFVVLVAVLNYRSVLPVRNGAPDWRESVRVAREQCRAPGVPSVTVPVAPGPPENWHVEVPCER